MSIEDVKHLWKVQGIPSQPKHNPPTGPYTLCTVWTDWHDVLGTAVVDRQSQQNRAAARAGRSVAAVRPTLHPSSYPTNYTWATSTDHLYADEDESEALLREAAAHADWSRVRAQHNVEVVGTRWTLRTAHVMDDDAAALLAARLHLAQSPYNTLEDWRESGCAALGSGDGPAYHFLASQNGWNWPRAQSPAGHRSPEASPPSSVSSVVTPPDDPFPVVGMKDCELDLMCGHLVGEETQAKIVHIPLQTVDVGVSFGAPTLAACRPVGGIIIAGAEREVNSSIRLV
ncbi:hypothetical protein PsYK624_135290 [Phanerochaete sordida]|uniref:Uncharacterized protein n=1 Tax=Phanerochaete sordida TaxID=48140 RepID=A0A9P3GLT8_9APHY|nr:hypothetical protein PsYK624_135290 [Phanerochaete sordida]